jgi:ribosome biogenesis GTP-binding protein YlqF
MREFRTTGVSRRSVFRATQLSRSRPVVGVHARATIQETLVDTDVAQSFFHEKHIIQWYPGHIAKAERQLKEQLSRVDAVLEVRDARILQSTQHPMLTTWIQNKRHFVIVNRVDMVRAADVKKWREHFRILGKQAQVFYTNGKSGDGVHAVIKAAEKLSIDVNANRIRRGLKSRPVRACLVGYPNVGKSALINRLLNRRVVNSAALPGVTRALQWVRMGKELDLLDSPGIIPASMNNQDAAGKLAICNDIGEASYIASSVAVCLLSQLPSLPGAKKIVRKVEERYQVSYADGSTEDMLWQLADRLFAGDIEVAAQRVLKDFRDLRLGCFALEFPLSCRRDIASTVR